MNKKIAVISGLHNLLLTFENENEIKECDTCGEEIDHNTLDSHKKCSECARMYVCCDSGVCIWCVVKHPYHFVTENIAVGSRHTPYEPFDIIIDMNSPDNGLVEGDIKLVKNRRIGRRTQYVFKFGIQDCPLPGYLDYARSVFDGICRVITKITNRRPNDKILFHCWAGVSRSATAAIYYLSKCQNIHIDDAFRLVKDKRKWIKPNEGFLKILGDLNK